MKTHISNLKQEINLFYFQRDSMNADGSETCKIKNLRKEIKTFKKKLITKELHAKSAKKYRDNLRVVVDTSIEKNPIESSKGTQTGRQRLEKKQPELLKTISDMTMFRGSTQ